MTPFIGFIGTIELMESQEQESYRGMKWNPGEVSHIFTLPMTKILDPEMMGEQSLHIGNGRSPYWRGPSRTVEYVKEDRKDQEQFNELNTITIDSKDHYKIWGLSAYVLTEFLKIVALPFLKKSEPKI